MFLMCAATSVVLMPDFPKLGRVFFAFDYSQKQTNLGSNSLLLEKVFLWWLTARGAPQNTFIALRR